MQGSFSEDKHQIWCQVGHRRGRQKMKCLGSLTDSMDMSLSKIWKIVKDREAGCAAVHWVAKSWTWLSNWITTTQISGLKTDQTDNGHIIILCLLCVHCTWAGLCFKFYSLEIYRLEFAFIIVYKIIVQ